MLNGKNINKHIELISISLHYQNKKGGITALIWHSSAWYRKSKPISFPSIAIFQMIFLDPAKMFDKIHINASYKAEDTLAVFQRIS